MEGNKEYSHCLICRRKLSNEKYRKTGIGPVCLKKYQKKFIKKIVQIELF
ncbi:DUF6011 domain-containing protein [Paenibacillus sp. 2RAB27]